MHGLYLSGLVTTVESYRLPSSIPGTPKQVVVLDYGVKRNMLHHLNQRGCDLPVLPASATLEDVLACAPQGVLLSNGPGDPAAMEDQVGSVRGLLDRGIPIMGIC